MDCTNQHSTPTAATPTWAKRGGVVDSCTTSAPHDLLVAPLAHTDLHIADNRHSTHENPGRNHPAGRDPSKRYIGCGASTHNHDDAYCGAKVEYRTSSTPAYTDELDLHHSTNNTPTTTRGRCTLRIADNNSGTHHWRTPTKTRSRPALSIADCHSCTHHWCTPTSYRARHPSAGTPRTGV